MLYIPLRCELPKTKANQTYTTIIPLCYNTIKCLSCNTYEVHWLPNPQSCPLKFSSRRLLPNSRRLLNLPLSQPDAASATPRTKHPDTRCVKSFKVMPVARNDFIHICVLMFTMLRVGTHIGSNLTVFYGGLSVHGGCFRYEEIVKIQKWCNCLKGENLHFNLDVNLSASPEDV